MIVAVGGLTGALLLLWTGAAAFGVLVPWLLLGSPLIFAAGPYIASATIRLRSDHGLLSGTVEFVFAVYGGYFGAGLGVLLMAALTIIGVRDVQNANVQKNWLATVITTISVAVFSLGGGVAWPQTLSVLVGAMAGGYAGAR